MVIQWIYSLIRRLKKKEKEEPETPPQPNICCSVIDRLHKYRNPGIYDKKQAYEDAKEFSVMYVKVTTGDPSHLFNGKGFQVAENSRAYLGNFDEIRAIKANFVDSINNSNIDLEVQIGIATVDKKIKEHGGGKLISRAQNNYETLTNIVQMPPYKPKELKKTA